MKLLSRLRNAILLAMLLGSLTCKNPKPTSGKNSKLTTIGTIERIDPSFNDLVTQQAVIEVIGEGYSWSEGPVWIESENMLLFSDVPENIVYKWTAARGVEKYLQPSGYTGATPRGGEMGSNGLTISPEGRLALCQHGDRRVAYMNAPLLAPKSDFISIADNYQSKKFNSPNDLVFNSNGDLFFTDPPYGLEKNVDDPKKEISFQGVYMVKKGQQAALLTDTITRPNGIAFMPGERKLIVANSDPQKAIWYEFTLNDQGFVTGSRIYRDVTPESKNETGLPDGLKIDKRGNMYATGPGGVWVFNRDGKVIGKIKVPQPTSNCALTSDEKTLFITSDMNLLRVRMR